jgi:translation initiation factor 1A
VQIALQHHLQRGYEDVPQPLRGVLLTSEEIELGKRKVLNEAHLKELVLPQQGEILGRVLKISGGNQVIVQCVDGVTRACRIRGKMKRRMWIRERDIVLVSPWDFDPKHADIMWRYIKDHADWLQNNGYLDKREEPKAATATEAAAVSRSAEPQGPASSTLWSDSALTGVAASLPSSTSWPRRRARESTRST